jgi:WD40 repeat protein
MSAVSAPATLSARNAWSTTSTFELADTPSVLAWSPDGGLLAAASLGGDAILADPTSGEAVATMDEHEGGVLCGQWTPDGRLFAAGGQDGQLSLWDRAATTTRRVEVGGWVGDLTWSAGNRWLAAASDRSLFVTDNAGAVVRRYDDHPSTVTSLAWEPKGRRVAAAFYGGVRWYEPGREQGTAVDRLAWKGSILSVAVSSDGRWLAAGNQDRSVQLWRLGKDTHLEMPGYPSKVDRLSFDDTGRYLAVANVGFVTVWDCAGRGPEGSKPRLLDGHRGRIGAIGWQPNGRSLATGAADGLLTIWEPSRNAKPLAVTEAGVAVAALSWNPGGDAIAVATSDGRVRVLAP